MGFNSGFKGLMHIYFNRSVSNIMNLIEVLRSGIVFKLQLTGGLKFWW